MLFLAFSLLQSTTIKRERYICTWLIRVSKHLLISFNFACLSLFTVLFAKFCFFILSYLFIYLIFWGVGGGVVLWLRICVEVAVDKISIQPHLPPSLVFCFVPTLSSLFNTSDSYLKSERA